jgi:hypothetical protein
MTLGPDFRHKATVLGRRSVTKADKPGPPHFDLVSKRKFSAKARDAAASKGAALPDGSFPIENKDDLKNAIQAIGRAKDPEKAKAHIIQRAKALNAEDLLPEDWETGADTDSDADDKGK